MAAPLLELIDKPLTEAIQAAHLTPEQAAALEVCCAKLNPNPERNPDPDPAPNTRTHRFRNH